MSFNMEKFSAAKFQPRTKAVPVPELKDFFDDGEKPEFIIKSLDANEFGAVMEEVSSAKSANLQRLMSDISGGDTDRIVAGFQEFMSARREALPDDVVKRMHLIRRGVISPPLDMASVFKLSKHAEIFYRLSAAVMDITGVGPITQGESKGSGQSHESRTQPEPVPTESQTEELQA